MLKLRLIFGTLIVSVFLALMLLDGWIDGSITSVITDDRQIQATILCILTALLAFPVQYELASLFVPKNVKIFVPVTCVFSAAAGTAFYWKQFLGEAFGEYVLLLIAAFLIAIYVYQYRTSKIAGSIGNLGASCFSVVYLGFMSAFILGIRIEFGLWPLLMFIFVVKACDIGAYTAGRIFGKHSFSPLISPKKTWEGMAGGVVLASVVSVVVANLFGIMHFWYALVFGIGFAFVGQLGDLAESMLKRDAQQKDSAASVPGFGGLLDVLDSLLIAAPVAYVYFRLVVT